MHGLPKTKRKKEIAKSLSGVIPHGMRDVSQASQVLLLMFLI